jgi:hypothetical protein
MARLALLPHLDPPLDPSGDEARSLLRRELADPKYYDDNLLERVTSWLDRLIANSIDGAAGSPPLTVAVAIAVALLLAVGAMLIVSRTRGTTRGDGTAAPALTDEVITADELRTRAEAALAAGDASSALVDAFRAAAVRQVERARIEEVPQATAHELARALASEFPEHAGAVHRGADLFDLTLYGEREARREQAVELLQLDDLLAGRTVRR